ncbi:MAG: S-adenosylmethionine decarboxylase proenzyme [Candidatus Firestonebacteria bacterium RIFOXYC2_FULL_39_67]|nr:MAG: S-adenosylmethionine decarboxylase proenzyme [Candidatus Firestonebacteria bacterium RIFOXYD2_FULL_39_29]OGF54802.1 MAG: S-adenosylmethionine decarboxylase proenzyme [Candidatus Firestonebacteria bacterium RifOxyC12_full_39_7]OGF55260.1 MAG: S-adenosylmethionine decarboxylase proenzyme [Candidatus Firestonebacteria bacterium RIFOXYC2_FULL_39_67]
MKTIAWHISSKLHKCDPNKLNDFCFIQGVCLESVRVARFNLVNSAAYHHRLPNGKHQGISAVFIIEESHIAIYTYPEYGFAMLDILTCGSEEAAHKCHDFIVKQLKPGSIEKDNGEISGDFIPLKGWKSC